MASMVVRRAKSAIFDQYRGVFVNRGVFLKAPPDFFSSYPSDFEAPPLGWEKLGIKIRTIESWDRQRGIFQPAPATKIEIPAPLPTVVSAPVETVVSLAVEPVAAQVLSSEVASDVEPPKRGRGRPRNSEKKIAQ